jgi:hypothetical protein
MMQSNKILWWLLASVLSIAMVLASAGGASIIQREQGLEDRQDAMVIQQMTLDRRLAVIEGKLDILLLRIPRK